MSSHIKYYKVLNTKENNNVEYPRGSELLARASQSLLYKIHSLRQRM